MSQQEIQLQELEALEAIFPGELEIIDRDYPNIEIVINLAPHSVTFSQRFDFYFFRKSYVFG